MARSSGITAEEQFAKLRQKEKEALKERESAERVRSEKVERLRSLRLAKEAADKEAAALAPKAPPRKRAAKSAAKPA